jgi:Ca2+-binding EF-hand superfamily protein
MATADVQASWKKVFDHYDTDKSGQINRKELVVCMKELLDTEDEAEATTYAKDVMGQCDKDNDNKISWIEFRAALMKKHT